MGSGGAERGGMGTGHCRRSQRQDRLLMPAPAGGEGPCPSAALLNDGLAIEASLRVPSICTWADPGLPGPRAGTARGYGSFIQWVWRRRSRMPAAARRGFPLSVCRHPDPRGRYLAKATPRPFVVGATPAHRAGANAPRQISSCCWHSIDFRGLGAITSRHTRPICITFAMPGAIPDTPVRSAAVADPPVSCHGPIHTDPSPVPLRDLESCERTLGA